MQKTDVAARLSAGSIFVKVCVCACVYFCVCV